MPAGRRSPNANPPPSTPLPRGEQARRDPRSTSRTRRRDRRIGLRSQCPSRNRRAGSLPGRRRLRLGQGVPQPARGADAPPVPQRGHRWWRGPVERHRATVGRHRIERVAPRPSPATGVSPLTLPSCTRTQLPSATFQHRAAPPPLDSPQPPAGHRSGSPGATGAQHFDRRWERAVDPLPGHVIAPPGLIAPPTPVAAHLFP
jgi:hypothetical protein